MRGQDKLIAMRGRGWKPVMVFLNDFKTKPEFFDGTNIEIAGDEPKLLDLRFLTGLSVAASSHDEQRVRDILEACKNAGAGFVAVCHLPEPKSKRQKADYMEIWNAAT